MKKNKKIVVLILILLAVLSIIVYLAVNHKQNKESSPERLIEAVLNDIVSETEIDIEKFNQKYQAYFTEEAYTQALNERIFGMFCTLSSQYNSENKAEIKSISLEKLNENTDGTEYFAQMQVQFGSDAEENFNAQIRLISENGQWLIDYLTIDS